MGGLLKKKNTTVGVAAITIFRGTDHQLNRADGQPVHGEMALGRISTDHGSET